MLIKPAIVNTIPPKPLAQAWGSLFRIKKRQDATPAAFATGSDSRCFAAF